ncbi:ABC transporter permease [Coprococcus sp. AF21-14LB]|uniref:ABC transporter permease n=1 Tax=Coprococcus sp. AF21-14LB TaxID=2292231 RepID=UPI002695ADE4|nr:ABC transporter permease [Coprococcus sp. AF21-14LB]
MKGIREIFRKEIARVVKDKKMLFSVFLLPALLMVGLMMLIGNLQKNMMADIDNHIPVIYAERFPESFQKFLETGGYTYDLRAMESETVVKDELTSGQADLWLQFPENFEESIASYQKGDEIPQIKVYYNPSEEYSMSAFREVTGTVLESYRQTLLAGRVGDLEQLMIFTVNTDNPDMIVQDEKKANGKELGMMLPYFITILLFAGAMGIGTDMIAGEKERGTMASLLVSPVKRSSIVLGKVFALMIISGISSLIYVAVMVISMPLMSGTLSGMGTEAKTFDYIWTGSHVGGDIDCTRIFVCHTDRIILRICQIHKRGEYLCDAGIYSCSCYRIDVNVYESGAINRSVLYSAL